VIRRAWSGVSWFVRLEIGIWRSLFLWVTRRVAGQGPGVATFSYARQILPLLAAFIFVSLIELPVVHLLIPWDTVRLVALVVSVWGLLWMLGLLASMKVFPHLLDDAELRIATARASTSTSPGRRSRASPRGGAAWPRASTSWSSTARTAPSRACPC
jgi:hypothetical protein